MWSYACSRAANAHGLAKSDGMNMASQGNQLAETPAELLSGSASTEDERSGRSGSIHQIVRKYLPKPRKILDSEGLNISERRGRAAMQTPSGFLGCRFVSCTCAPVTTRIKDNWASRHSSQRGKNTAKWVCDGCRWRTRARQASKRLKGMGCRQVVLSDLCNLQSCVTKLVLEESFRVGNPCSPVRQ